jgi:branched-chain amino acid transport system ATP-binding protein
MAAVTLLEARGLTRHFGGVRAVEAVDLDLATGEIHALIGPNGAGKTTLVGLISGRLMPDAGHVRFDDRDITRLPAHARVRLGIAYTFQVTSIYPRLSVFDNVGLAVQRRDPPDLASDTLAYGHQRLLELAMGLALRPKLLILDEPTQGLAAAEIDGFKTLAREVAGAATLLLIEHNMDVVMDLADRITVLNFGETLATGTPQAIREDRAVQAAYLGA